MNEVFVLSNTTVYMWIVNLCFIELDQLQGYSAEKIFTFHEGQYASTHPPLIKFLLSAQQPPCNIYKIRGIGRCFIEIVRGVDLKVNSLPFHNIKASCDKTNTLWISVVVGLGWPYKMVWQSAIYNFISILDVWLVILSISATFSTTKLCLI